MHIVIAGAGAVGCFVGARLALAGHQVTLAGRPALVDAVARAGGLTLIEPGAPPRPVPGVRAAPGIAAALATAPAGLVLLTVKAYDTAGAAAELAAAAPGLPVLSLQNGVGNEETLAAALGAGSVIAGAIETPVSIPAAGQVRVHRARYRVGLAPVGAAAPARAAAQTLAGAGFRVDQYADYRSLKWTKLLMNLLANASSAILDWTPAQVMAHPATARLEARAWQEALAVMVRLGIHPITLAGYPFRLLAPLARALPPSWLARGLRGFVAGGRGSKMPSLHIALASGRPSEVAWLNGAVARYGEGAGVPVPINAGLTRILTALSEGRADRSALRGRPEALVEQVAAMR